MTSNDNGSTDHRLALLLRTGSSMDSSAGQGGSATLDDADIQIGIVERYIHDALNARSDLIENDDRCRRAVSSKVLNDIEIFFADHMKAVVAARNRLTRRADSEGRAMYAFIDEVVFLHSSARDVTLAALERIIG